MSCNCQSFGEVAHNFRHKKPPFLTLFVIVLGMSTFLSCASKNTVPHDTVDGDAVNYEDGWHNDSSVVSDSNTPRDNNGTATDTSVHTDSNQQSDGDQPKDTAVSKDVPPDPMIQACCSNGACYDWTGDQCTEKGGTKYKGKTCSDNPCGLFACLSNGLCHDRVSKDNCEKVLVGTWREGKKCSDGLLKTSACCAHGRCIDDLSQETCEGDAGVWHDNKTCDQNPCAFGSCCGPTVNGIVKGCVDMITSRQCSNFGGVWKGGYRCWDEIDDVDVCAGACCVDDQHGGYCQDGETADKCKGTGTFSLGKSCSDQPCPRQMWACCTQIGCRDFWSEERCESDGVSTWRYQKTCTSSLCSPPETENACCINNQWDVGCFSDYSEHSCVNLKKGTYIKSTSCSTNPCGFEYGACCNTTDMTCIDYQTASQCEDDGMVWHKGAECDDNPCGINYGACCYTSFSFPRCSDDYKEKNCVGTGVTFHKDAKCKDNPCHWEDIYETGACCYPNDSTCRDDVLAPDCNGDAQEPDFYANVKCSSQPCGFKTGACCNNRDSVGQCSDGVFATDCDGNYEEFFEDAECNDNPCGLGACYNEVTGNCYDDYVESSCYSSLTWEKGKTCDEVTFKETGACILPDSSCKTSTEAQCNKDNGTWLRRVDCFKMDPDPLWACCDDDCSHSGSVGCANGPAVWREGLYCTHNPCHLWACCKDNECSDNVSESTCSAGGGIWHNGQVCDNSPCQGACCKGSTCDDSKTEDVCKNGSGSWHDGKSCWDLPCK